MNYVLWNNAGQTANDVLLSSFTWLQEFQQARKPAKTPTAKHSVSETG